MCTKHPALYNLIWLLREESFPDFKHSAFKHKILSIFQTNLQLQFELFTIFINYAFAINVGCAFPKRRKKT